MLCSRARGCPIALLIGDLAQRTIPRMLLDHSARHALARWRAFGRSQRGARHTRRDNIRIAAAGVRLDDVGDAGSPCGSLHSWDGGLRPSAGWPDRQGARWIDAVIDGSGPDRRTLADRRVAAHQGRASAVGGCPGAADARISSGSARLGAPAGRSFLGTARRYSLARLLCDQSRSAEALELLQPVYDRFTEGFETADLKAAKALLDALHTWAMVGVARRLFWPTASVAVVPACITDFDSTGMRRPTPFRRLARSLPLRSRSARRPVRSRLRPAGSSIVAGIG